MDAKSNLLAVGVAVGAMGLATAAWAGENSSQTAISLATGNTADRVPDTGTTNAPQGSTNSTAGNAAGRLEEVVVTAQKRSERLQDVPLSVSAFTEQTIEKQGITNLEDYASRVPGVRLQQDGNQDTVTIRGISTSAQTGVTSATAGIYVDDYPLFDTWYRQSTPDLHIFDVERIEVLRGPQGTLYGATSLSGSIRVITNKPDLNSFGAKFEGTLAGTDGGADSYAVNGMVNVPLIDGKIGARFIGYSAEDGGYIDNYVTGRKNTNARRSYGGRAYVAMQPSDDLKIVANLTVQGDEQDDASATIYGFPPSHGYNAFNSRVPSTVRGRVLVGSLSAEQKLGDGVLSLTGTYGENVSHNFTDLTYYTGYILGAFGVTAAPNPTAEYFPSASHTHIVEARYTSDDSGRFRYVLGAYYNERWRYLTLTSSQPQLTAVVGTSDLVNGRTSQTATEVAIFGEGTYSITPELDATVGIRLFRNSYRFTSYLDGLINNFASPTTASVSNLGSGQSSYTPRFSISYKPTSDLNFYATASKGYRFGLTNFVIGGSTMGLPLTYKSDSLWNYEIGAKTILLDGKATFNVSLYYIDWSKIQINFRFPNGQSYITNAGNARSEGVEAEFDYRPIDALQLNAALSIGDAVLTTSNPNIVRRQASIHGSQITGVLKGDHLPGSTDISASGGAQYDFLRLDAGSAYLRVDDVFVGPSYIDFMKQGSLKMGDYNVINARLGWKSDNYELALFANNLFESHGVVSAASDVDVIYGTDAAFRVRPRTFGVTLRANY